MGEKKYLRRVYDLETQQQTDDLYSAWAETYDEEVREQGYQSPQRCAEALAMFVPSDAPVLDIGCGTGFSGAALVEAGFTNVSGSDVNADMLAVAQARDIYRDLAVADIANPFPFEPGTYAGFAAVGVIGLGAAPLSLLDEALSAMAPGDHLTFSFNDHALADRAFPGAIERLVASSVAEEVFCEYGPHFTGLDSNSNVYVLRRT